jgi:hypothetical protein
MFLVGPKVFSFLMVPFLFNVERNFEESSYVARVFLPRAIYENDIVFIEIYGIHSVF